MAPWVALGCLALAVAPLLWAGAEKEIVPVTSVDMVERNVPTTVTYVSLPGLAMSLRLPGPGASDAPPYGLLVRDTAASDALTIVTTDVDPRQLLSRTVVGRVTTRPYLAAAEAAFAARGESTTGLDGSLILIEVVPAEDESITDVGSPADLAELPDDTLVRVPLRFDGESVAACVVAGNCAPRALAAGNGAFVHLARGADRSAPILVQTTSAASSVPGRWQGSQVRNGEQLEDFVSTVPVRALAGWARILVVASIEDDPGLARSKSWLGPALLALVAVLLWLGGRVGYPYFRPIVEGSRRWSATGVLPPDDTARLAPAAISARVSGHALTVDGHRRHLDERPAELRAPSVAAADAARVTAALHLDDGGVVPLAAHDTGILGQVERGEVVSLEGSRPALWVHWYGTDLRITFDSVADRDNAQRLAEGTLAPLRSPR